MFRKKETTLLLLLSLSIGLTAYMLISAKVTYHHSFDTYLANYKNIYRIVSSVYTDNTLTISQPRTQRILGQAIEANYPEVRLSGYICGTVENHFKIGDNSFTNQHSYHCSSGFAELFSIQIQQGNSMDILTKPNTVIISESFARKHFGDESPIGKIVHQYPAHNFEIEAVYRDFPENSHIRPEVLISFHDNMHLPPPLKENWGEFSFYTYLYIKDQTDLKKLEHGITQLCAEHNNTRIQKSNTRYDFSLQALKDIHTKSQLKNEITRNVRGDYLLILQLISVFILIISGFNYIYFSYTRITSNSVQFGIRKVFGASNNALLSRFMIESITMHTIAMVISVLVIELIPYMSTEADEIVSYSLLPGKFWVSLITAFMASSVLNPIVLSMMLVKKSPLALLTQRFENYHRSISFRQIITMLQFVIIIFLISSISGINRQVKFLKSRDIGIDIQDKLVIKTPSNLRRSSGRINNLDAFEEELTKISGLHNVSISNVVPGDLPTYTFKASDKKDMNGIKTALFIADNYFLKSFRIEMLAGKGFNETGNNGSIINSVCMLQLGYKDPGEILGKTLFLQDESATQTIETEIMGVCKAFNFTNTKETPGPVVLLDWTKEIIWENYTLSLSPNMKEQELIPQVEALFSQTFPNYSFEYFWLDDYYNKQFDEDQAVIISLKNFALVAVLLAVVSLLSMVWYMSQARTKEIGIRKVNGATQYDIIQLLNLHFLKWIGLASLIALPISWYFLYYWLSSFAYRTSISVWIFVISSGAALIIGIITVSLQSIKAANVNPVKSLKHE